MIYSMFPQINSIPPAHSTRPGVFNKFQERRQSRASDCVYVLSRTNKQCRTINHINPDEPSQLSYATRLHHETSFGCIKYTTRHEEKSIDRHRMPLVCAARRAPRENLLIFPNHKTRQAGIIQENRINKGGNVVRSIISFFFGEKW